MRKSFTVKDKEYWLKYDFNAVADMEEKMGGRSITTIFSEDNAGFSAMRLLIWGGIKHAINGLTVQRVGMLLQEYIEEGGDVGQLINDAGILLGQHLKMGDSKKEGE